VIALYQNLNECQALYDSTASLVT